MKVEQTRFQWLRKKGVEQEQRSKYTNSVTFSDSTERRHNNNEDNYMVVGTEFCVQHPVWRMPKSGSGTFEIQIKTDISRKSTVTAFLCP